MKRGDKLYLVTREDLPIGAQAVQAAHALRQFASEHPDVDREWFEKSNFLGLHTVIDEMHLISLRELALMKGLRVSSFREEDLGFQFTAVAIEPGNAARALCEPLRQLGGATRSG